MHKTIILISTFYHDTTITETKQKPEIIQFYNEKKYGIGEMDELLENIHYAETSK